MTLQSDTKFKEKLSSSFKYDMNFVTLNPSTRNHSIYFLSEVWGLSYKNTEELSFMTLNTDAKFE